MVEAKIGKEEFEAYVKIQKSGVTNMLNVRLVAQLSGLTEEQVVAIIANYGHFSKIYGISG